MATLRIATMALFLSLLAFPAWSQSDTAMLSGSATVVTVPLNGNEQESVASIICETVLIGLADRGVSGISSGIQLADDEPSRREATQIARETGSTFVLIARYDTQNIEQNALGITLRLYLVDPFTDLGRADGTVTVDLLLDRWIGNLLDELLNSATTQLDAMESDILPADGGAPVGTGTGGSTPSSATTQTTGDPITGATYAAPALSTLQFTAGYAPAFAVGQAASYYRFGHGANARIEIILGSRGALGIGLAGSAVFAQAAGAAADGNLLLVPAAVTVSLRTSAGPMSARVTAGGGASLIRIHNDTLGTYLKIAPYVTGGLDLTMSFWRGLGLSAGVAFDTTFEGSVLLMSFVPTISLSLGL